MHRETQAALFQSTNSKLLMREQRQVLGAHKSRLFRSKIRIYFAVEKLLGIRGEWVMIQRIDIFSEITELLLVFALNFRVRHFQRSFTA